jgi:hypothetical protein
VFLAVFLVATIFVSPVFAQQGNAQDAISSAKNTIKNCYDAVAQAESAGANVDSLMVTLNDAASSLSKAELAYSANDYGSAYTYATQCQSKLADLTSQAATLKTDAQAAASQNFLINILLVAVSIGVLCSGIAAWVILGRRERRSVHEPSTV